MDFNNLIKKVNKKECRCIKMASGYLILPFSHIPVTTGVDPEKCKYAFIFHSENSDKYHIPYFVFFHEERYPPKEDYEDMYNQCKVIFERFDKLRALEIPLDGAHEKITNSAFKLLCEAPRFDLFRAQTEQEVRRKMKQDHMYTPPNDVIILHEL